jgi:hypothetical protein
MEIRRTKGRDSKEYKEWALKVKIRDNWECQECGCKIKKLLHSHHIKSWQHYIFSRFDVKNGITLCLRCHANHHPHMKDFLMGKVRKKRRKLNKVIKLINKRKAKF